MKTIQQLLGDKKLQVWSIGPDASVYIGRALPKSMRRESHFNTDYLYGGTSRARREQMIDAFQDPDSDFTRPVPASASPDYHAFWHGAKRLPSERPPMRAAEVPAILIRKGGDSPAFWDQDASFVALMEELSLRVREKNKTLL